MVTCIGELIVDFVSEEPGKSLIHARRFKKTAGGAPANVAVGLARLGVQTSFMGRVGDDPFGTFLCRELEQAGVNTSGISPAKEYKTRLAFVSLTETGERDFDFWELHPADIYLLRSHIDLRRLRKSRIVHISSFLLLNEPARSTLIGIISEIQSLGALISFDPNIRFSLWKSKTLAKQLLLKIIRFTSILRMNESEAQFLTGEDDIMRAAMKLEQMGPKLVVITRGERGCFVSSGGEGQEVDGFSVNAIDTTGCGDGFLAGLLFGILSEDKNPESLTRSELSAICRKANAVGALVATKQGAIPALPSLEELESFLNKSDGTAHAP